MTPIAEMSDILPKDLIHRKGSITSVHASIIGDTAPPSTVAAGRDHQLCRSYSWMSMPIEFHTMIRHMHTAEKKSAMDTTPTVHRPHLPPAARPRPTKVCTCGTTSKQSTSSFPV